MVIIIAGYLEVNDRAGKGLRTGSIRRISVIPPVVRIKVEWYVSEAGWQDSAKSSKRQFKIRSAAGGAKKVRRGTALNRKSSSIA